MQNIAAPMSNMQVEMLKLYSAGLPDAYLEDIKILVARYLFAQARAKADKTWDEKAYSDERIDALIREILPQP